MLNLTIIISIDQRKLRVQVVSTEHARCGVLVVMHVALSFFYWRAIDIFIICVALAAIFFIVAIPGVDCDRVLFVGVLLNGNV
jgi:hypothetical protein